jgi:hypothetical protein
MAREAICPGSGGPWNVGRGISQSVTPTIAAPCNQSVQNQQCAAGNPSSCRQHDRASSLAAEQGI